jgi:hypothetical protein
VDSGDSANLAGSIVGVVGGGDDSEHRRSLVGSEGPMVRRCGAAGMPPRLRSVGWRWAGPEGQPALENDDEATTDYDSKTTVRP